MKILIKNCNLISMSERREKYEEGIDILINNDKIEKIEKNITEAECEKVIDATGKVVMPGFINTHTHVPMSIFRDTLDGYGLQEWLNDKIWPMEDKLNEEDIYYSSLLSCIEMIKGGTVCCNDQYFMTDSIIKAALETGLKIHCTRTLMDIGGNLEERLEELEELVKKYEKKEYEDKVKINVGVHGLYTCTKECVKKAVELAKEYNLYIHMHFAENSKEIEDIKKFHNTNSPVDLLQEYYKDMHIVLAHCVKIKPEEMNKLKDLDISIAHCPVSNLKLGCGIAKISDFMKNNINVTLGTDGQGSGSNLDMFSTMAYTALLQKGDNEDATLLPAYDVIKMATINGAKALRIDNETGSIEVGKQADLIIIDLQDTMTQPINDIFSNIVYNTRPNNVINTIVNGNILMEDRKINGINEKEIYEKCNNIIRRIS
jgi:5-methylthioadenosine/S-adenosylhomocysteine deaminase